MKHMSVAITLLLSPMIVGLRCQAQASVECTAADFQGTYGYSGAGTILAGPNAGPVAFVGQLTADGKGTFTGGDTVSINGRIVRRTYSAKYTVNPDCRG